MLVFAAACSVPQDKKSPALPITAGAPTLTPSVFKNEQQNALHAYAQQTPVLSVGEQNIVSLEAHKLLAHNEQQATQIAHDLHFAEGEEDPSNMCGPLALYILRQAGIVPPSTSPHSFWLLDPPKDRDVINKIFPKDQFNDFIVHESINKFDFSKFPLRVGDFVFLYAGKNGTFQHMLVVTRVDEVGRAYSVTNYDVAPKSFVIQEVMLYDPTQPGVGKFYDWTNYQYDRLGLTGFGGFEVWRRISPIVQ